MGEHVDFVIETEHGPAIVLGDPDMPEETKQALRAMIEAAYKMLAERGDDDTGQGDV